MKRDIHPKSEPVLFTCASCGSEYVILSTRTAGPKREYQGREYPSMTLEICAHCHPFFSGKQVYVDTAGRVEKFQRRYGSLTGVKETQEVGQADKASQETTDQAAGDKAETAAASSDQSSKSSSAKAARKKGK